VDVEPYTPAVYEASGKQDPAFRTKLVLARQLVERAIGEGLPFRAMVADSFYGEDRTLRQELRTLGVPYVMALGPSHAWWHPEDVAGTLQDVAHEAGWVSAEQPGKWVHLTRTFRDGSAQDWWVVEIVAGPYGPDKTERAIVVFDVFIALPDLSTWSLVTNLPAPTERLGSEPPFPPASLEEVIRLYGLRMWVEQSYKHVKHAASLVPVSGERRPGHPAALAVSLVCLLLLLVSCLSPFCQCDASGESAIGASSSPPHQRSC